MPSRQHLATAGDILVVPTGWGWRAVLLASVVEARDAAKLPTTHRTAPTAKGDLAPNVSGATAEKPGPADEIRDEQLQST